MIQRRKSGFSAIGKFLLLLIIVSTVIGAAYLGPQRAWRIGAAAVSNKFLDRPDKDTEHLLPIIEIKVDKVDLEALNADLPWSGGQKVQVVWRENGIEHPGSFRYRGLVAPTHYLGDKKSFRLSMKGSNPYRPIKTLNLINPKSLNMLNNHLALWIGGYMGVAVPFDELVYVRLNGNDYGVMELFEQVNGNFERIRNLGEEQVPVYKGDFPPLKGKELPAHVSLWKNPQHWQYASKADSSFSHSQLTDLIGLMKSKGNPAFDTLGVPFADSIAQFVDVPDMIRYFASLKVINTKHIDNYHNQWLVMNKDKRFYPILWDPLMMFPPENEPWYPIHDALAFHLLSVPEWRVERDRIIHQAIQDLYHDSAFIGYFEQVRNRLRPSLMADPNKYGAITIDPYDVFPFSSAHAAISSDKLLKRTLSYWSQLESEMSIEDLRYSQRDSTMEISWTGNVAMELRLGPDSLPQPRLLTEGVEWKVTSDGEFWTALLVPDVVQRGTENGNAFSDRTWYEVQRASFVITTDAPPNTIKLFNAVTHAPIEKK